MQVEITDVLTRVVALGDVNRLPAVPARDLVTHRKVSVTDLAGFRLMEDLQFMASFAFSLLRRLGLDPGLHQRLLLHQVPDRRLH